MSSVILGSLVQVETRNPTLPKIVDDHRYAAHSLRLSMRARFASGSATAEELHHVRDIAPALAN